MDDSGEYRQNTAIHHTVSHNKPLGPAASNVSDMEFEDVVSCSTSGKVDCGGWQLDNT